jgi:uncharacterized protein YegL
MSQNHMLVRIQELIANPSSRVPIVLCLDASSSMTGAPMTELNEGLRMFIDAVRQDPIASASVELCVVVFGTQASVAMNFRTLADGDAGQLAATAGATNLGAGVRLALDQLDARKQSYKRVGVDYFQPWLVLMTDGQPTTQEHVEASARTCELEQAGKLVVFPIGIGQTADMNTLRMFSKKRSPLRLQGLNFRQFFEWLSKSVARVSQSSPGDKVPLDIDGIKGWAEI